MVLRVEPASCGVGPRLVDTQWRWNQFYDIEGVRSFTDNVCSQSPMSKPRAVLDWCNYNIAYKTDKEQFGRIDLFQTPLELIDSRVGDCEDISFLAASMLQAVGVSTAFVCFGDIPGGYHAWIEMQCKAGYYIVEPQIGHVWVEGERGMVSYNPEYVITPNGCYYNLDY